MAIILNDNIKANIAKPLEDKRMNNGVPYTDVAQANSLLNPVVDRYESLEVVIGTPSNWSIYWYKDGVADSDLVLKQDGGDVTAAGNNNFTGQNTFEEITEFNSAITANGGIETPTGVFFLDGANYLGLDAPTITANRTVTIQDGNGTLAFLSDIPSPIDISGKVDKAGDTMTGNLAIQGDLDVENIEINGGQIDNLANATQPQQAATKNQLDSEISSVRSDFSSVYRAAGDWDASVGTFPTTGTGLGGAVRRGDTYNVTAAGTIVGFEPLDVGDTFYANVNNPVQTASNWRKFEANTAQATESFRGTAKIATQVVIENESTLNDTDSVTPSKFWLGWNRIKQLASTFAAKITFTTAPRFSSTTANQYLRVDGSKDLTSVSAIPAADVTETTTRRFVTDTEKTTWNGKLSTDFSNITGVPTNTGNAYSVTVPATLPSPPLNGQPILFKPQAVNTGAATLAVNGGTAYPINKGETTALASGDLQAGKNYMLHFNTANNSWQILGELRNDNILNQTASLQTGGFYTGTGRLDTGLGLGIAPNSGAFETVAAATSAKAQLLLTQSTTDYTGTANGMLWNNTGELKFIDNAIVNRVFKWYNNELGKSDGNYVVTLNQYGDASVNIKVTERWVYDTDVLAAITAATWTSDRATITPANSKKMYKGQRHDDGTYSYEAIDDNKVKRW